MTESEGDIEDPKQKILLDAVKKLTNEPVHAKSLKKLQGLSDNEILALFFKHKPKYNAYSLTRFGAKILKHCFDFWEVDIDKPLTARQHLLLARECQLPYYIDEGTIVVFEACIGVLLKVSEGNSKYIEQMFAH